MPAKIADGPLSFNIEVSRGTTFWRCVESIMRVFNTSKGVVTPAATAPAIEPKMAPSRAVTLSLPFVLLLHSFMPSHSGNCITVNGTSRMIVMPQPRYSSFQTCARPCDRRWPRICCKAASEEGCCNAWARCLTTSVGTRTAQAATSPRLAAAMWLSGSFQPTLVAGGVTLVPSAVCRVSVRVRFARARLALS
ncbi:hypothetical protein MPH_03567 [Macrophomina phaseolina MS6]|uniref:Uncharacterized protein n=1 Tax=Macrophomina phaseolina (strain MS6) TaxID=1126212 RepID=K2S2E8_MACPH|nr:hypothetical protein MPH_03567 [Macrophomina phaseolina MS6]